jgi:hypothetical protein
MGSGRHEPDHLPGADRRPADLYSVAGYAYLHNEFLTTGKVPIGLEVPLQMSTIAQGVLGPAAGALMLIAIMVTPL